MTPTVASQLDLPLSAGAWRGFTPDTSDDAARKRFVELFGVEPAELRRGTSILLAGPIPGGYGRMHSDLPMHGDHVR
jgi:hypothetical protein